MELGVGVFTPTKSWDASHQPDFFRVMTTLIAANKLSVYGYVSRNKQEVCHDNHDMR